MVLSRSQEHTLWLLPCSACLLCRMQSKHVPCGVGSGPVHACEDHNFPARQHEGVGRLVFYHHNLPMEPARALACLTPLVALQLAS